MNTVSLTVGDLAESIESALERVASMLENGRLPVELEPLAHLAPSAPYKVHVTPRYANTGRRLRFDASAEYIDQDVVGFWITYDEEEEEEDSSPTRKRRKR